MTDKSAANYAPRLKTSDRPEFAEFLVKNGIHSISINPDSFFAVKNIVAATEAA